MTFAEIIKPLKQGKLCHRMSDDGFMYGIFNGKNLHEGLFVSDEDFELQLDQGICIKQIESENILAISPEYENKPLFEAWDWVLSKDDLTADDWHIWPDILIKTEIPNE
jgi:hypothetical protein